MSFSSCYNIKFLDDDHKMNYLKREFGYDFQAYPSNYFNTIHDRENNNNNNNNNVRGKILERIRRFQRFKNFVKVNEDDKAKGPTISVDDFGAKGDGNADDTNVSFFSFF